MKNYYYFCILLFTNYLFSQNVILYNKEGVKFSYTQTISQSYYCSQEDIDYDLVEIYYTISNNSGKKANVGFSIGIGPYAGNSAGCANNAHIDIQHFSPYGNGIESTVTLATGDDQYGKIGGWISRGSTPYWSVKPTFFNNSSNKTAKKTIANNNSSSKKGDYSLYQDDLRVNPEDPNKTINEQKKLKEQQDLQEQNYQNMVNAEKQRKAEQLRQQKLVAEQRQREYDYQEKVRQEKIRTEKENIEKRLERTKQSNTEIKNGVDNLVDNLTDIYKADSERRYQKEIAEIKSSNKKLENEDSEKENIVPKKNKTYSDECIRSSPNDREIGICEYSKKLDLVALFYLNKYLKINSKDPTTFYYLAQIKYRIKDSGYARDYPENVDFCKDWASYKAYDNKYSKNLNDGINLDSICGSYIYRTFAEIYDEEKCFESAAYCRKIAEQYDCLLNDPSGKSCGKKLLDKNIPKCP